MPLTYYKRIFNRTLLHYFSQATMLKEIFFVTIENIMYFSSI